ncbi:MULTISPECIES: cyclic nucleotide-binding domain-containing protein [unclassified Synechocystis]|uniref:cyclic nucleotide-binding domain-containing protein n=1 Tax=unclassified Synechocystis TaxID=2640012 RepID=UPI0003F50B60|nr:MULTISPECIES: cyclic nucleotide-binding domain-containing protein [unclassified Synechocystis]AIE74704.1 Potassium efflux system KefA protein / Small-conductance mechanosensitive channel [Synechocystis sp. PCC 6714]MCT0253942.1 mechanosensitive ion channel [Synechocystis sp. CS-94]
MFFFAAAITKIFDALEATTLSFGLTQLSLLDVFQMALSALAIFLVTHYFNRVLRGIVLQRFIYEQGIRYIVANLLSYGLGSFLLIAMLQASGVNLSSLTVVGGTLGLGIGLGLQNVTRNFVSGVTLLVEQKVKIGDYIRFQNIQGYVREVSTRAVVVGLKDGSKVILPSSMLIENQVINYHYETQTVRLTVAVGVAYGTDPVLVTETLLMCAYSQACVVTTPPAQVIFQNFGDNALEFELWVWIEERYMGQHPEILSALRYTICFYFKRNGIGIPWPQRELWLKNPEAIAKYFHPDLDLPTPSDSVPQEPIISLSKVLKSSDYFSSLNELEIRQLVEIGQLQSLLSEQVLFREQDPADGFYIVISGLVEVYTEKLGRVLASLGPGSFFGELALMLGIPRTASVRAKEKSLLFVVRFPQFEQLLQGNPDFREAIINALGEHQGELMRRKEELAAKGLLALEEEDSNIMNWVRKRLQRLFG